MQGAHARIPWMLLAILVIGFAGTLLYCSGEDGQPAGAAGATNDVNADCRGYCAAQAKAACTPPVEPDACHGSCLRTVEAHGNCGDSWRALMRCIAQVGLTCTSSGPQANGCSTEYSNYGRCLSDRIDGGQDAGGDR
jgi:hypothetical protein